MDYMIEVNHQRIKTNGIWLHVAEKGTGPLVLLLHGFPELWYAWRHQINHLAENGYHVVAPDLRGYGDSDSPLNPNSYTIFHIVGDLVGLLDHFGQQKVRSFCPTPIKPKVYKTVLFMNFYEHVHVMIYVSVRCLRIL